MNSYVIARSLPQADDEAISGVVAETPVRLLRFARNDTTKSNHA